MITLPSRIYSQYRTKPKFVDWMNIARTLGGDIDSAAKAVRDSYSIDTAEGEKLDVLARIVVIDRNFIADIDLGQVSFADDADAVQCGDDVAQMAGSTAATDSTMSDGLLRIAIRAKIAKNNGDATINSILRQMDSIVPNAEYLSVIDTGDMTFTVEVAGEIDNLTRWALFNVDLIQRPQGVRFRGFLELTDVDYFAPDAFAEQFGDEDVMFTYLGNL